MESSVVEEDASTASKTKGRRSIGKWICGSSSLKQNLREDNKITPPPAKASASYSSSTASSEEDKRDDRHGRKSSVPQRQMYSDYDLSFMSTPPLAAESAFGGRPRFDWIDVEYNAATRIQKIFRRHLVVREMQQAGLTTSYIRNRKRQRKARTTFYSASSEEEEETADLGFGCCSMGMVFGNEDTADRFAYKEYHRKRYEHKNKSRNEREEYLSQSYLEQKGIQSKYQELEEHKFNDDSILLREGSLGSFRSLRD